MLFEWKFGFLNAGLRSIQHTHQRHLDTIFIAPPFFTRSDSADLRSTISETDLIVIILPTCTEAF